MNDQKQDLALWRFGILAPLLHREAQGTTQAEMLHQITQKQWVRPDGDPIQLHPDTLRKWLYRYQKRGLAGLKNDDRKDKGKQGLAESLTTALFQLRDAHPRWTVQRLLNETQAQGIWNGQRPSRATLYRFVKTHHLQRDPHRAPPTSRSFAFESFGQLWMADFLHGPKIRDGRQRRKTYLHAILDDASRFIVQAGFYGAETVETLIQEMMLASRRHGLPQRFYTDNGACYSSRHLKLVCARLGIQLIHTPPYRPQGRGKVERFFRTVRDQFLTDQSFHSLTQLNSSFQSWLASYHESVHAALGISPFHQRLQISNCCQSLPEVVEIESLFRMERRCRVYKNGTVRLFNISYEVPDPVMGSRVTVYYLPWDLSTIYVGENAIPIRPLQIYSNAQRFQHPQGGSYDPDHA